MCVIMGKCDPGDTFCNGNFHRSTFEYFARSFYLRLWTSVILSHLRKVGMKLYRCVVESKFKFKDGHGYES